MKSGSSASFLVLAFSFIVSLIFVGCAGIQSAPHDLRPSALNEWATDARREAEVSERNPAQAAQSAGRGACFFERFKNPDSFEIQAAENDSRALPEKIRGQRDEIFKYFKGRIGGWVHPKFVPALASCTDPICFYEKVYGRPTAARLAYLFFLKTGMAVAASDAVPSVTSKASETGAGLADFLFSESELVTLVESAEAITTPAHSLFVQPQLRSIHKVPTTTLANAEETKVRKACGFANGEYIVLQSNCLGGNWQGRMARQDFKIFSEVNNGNDVFLHELGHCVDFNLGAGATISSRGDWTSISEVLKPSADGIIHYHQEPYPGFVTGYAATSYREDFAETLAHFRTRPDATKATAPAKSEFLKKNVFQGRDYTVAGIHGGFSAIINAKILDRMSEILSGCIGRPDTGRKPAYYRTQNLSASEIVCVEAEATRIAGEQFKTFRRAYPEGCLYAEGDWINSVLTPNADAISKSISSIETVRKLGVVRELMAASLDPKEAFLEFRKSAGATTLYRKALENNFEKYRAKFDEIGADLANGELQNYLARYEFELVKNVVQATILARMKSDTTKRAALVDQTFLTCVTAARVTTPIDLLKRDFKPNSAPLFLTCGRETWSRQLPSVVGAIFQKETAASSARFLAFAVEVANLDIEDMFRQRTEEEVQKLEKAMLEAAALRLRPNDAKPIPLAKILMTPVLEREDTCRGVVRKNLYDDVFRKSTISALLTYTQSLLALENDYCETYVDQNEKHRAELEEFRNQAARIVYTLAFKNWPKFFPQDATVFTSKNDPVEVVDPAFQSTCREKLGAELPNEPRLKSMLAHPAQAALALQGVVETCSNGRYAGRFVWRPSERFIEFGGIRSLGFAQFYTTVPKGAENRAYLYALKRYIQFRTAQKTDGKH